AITLNFGDNPEPLYIPYDSIVTFVDPSVEFGLRFDSHEEGEDDAEVVSLENTEDAPEAPMEEAESADEPAKDAEVVSLDSFRK
ncbi:MAG TPA: hypothetical protein ENK34_03290, partial [Rhodobacteraceae bacterium]|nr:hypothetical protein [Paracoccaceae bacterium]